MQLDIRIPIGLLFSIIGLLLIGFSFFADPAIYVRSMGININLWWGIVQLIFGGMMLLLAWNSAKKSD